MLPLTDNKLAIRYILRTLPLLLAVALYGYTVGLVLFLDDGPHFNIVMFQNGLNQWAGSYQYFYYRPAIFSLYKLAWYVAGQHFDPVGLHWLNVVLFGVAGVVTGMVARRAAPRYKELTGVLAGLGFVLFPFSYQAITLVGAMMHLVLIVCTGLMLWCVLLWLDGGGRGFLVAAWLCAFWGTFNQENGVLLAPLAILFMVGVHGPALLKRPLLRRRALIAVLPIAAITIIYLGLYVTVPRAPSPGGLQDLENIVQSASTLLQSLVYPLAALVRQVVAGTPAPPEMFLLMAAGVLPPLVYFGWQAIRRGEGQTLRVMLVSLGAYLLSLVPAVLMLDQNYVSGSPRILVFAALGWSIFWGLIVANWLHQQLILRVLSIALIGLAIVTSVHFLNGRRDLFQLQDVYMRRLDDLIIHQPFPTDKARILLVNAPDYLTPLEADRMFLRGTEGAAMMFRTTGYATQMWVNTEIWPNFVKTVKYHEILRVTGYSMYAHDPLVPADELVNRVRSQDVLYVTQFVGRDFYPVYVGSPTLSGPDEPLVTFGDNAIELTQSDMIYQPKRQVLAVRRRWRVNTPQTVQPFVHVFCGGDLIGQLDAAPWGETYPFVFWQPGETQTDFLEVHLSRPFNPDSCRALIGLYQQNDGQRLPAVEAASQKRFDNDLAPLTYRGSNDVVFPFS
jgi:hypothetical protein